MSINIKEWIFTDRHKRVGVPHLIALDRRLRGWPASAALLDARRVVDHRPDDHQQPDHPA